MNRQKKRYARVALLYALLTLAALFAAQKTPIHAVDLLTGYTLRWWTVDAGGGRSSGGIYALNGIAGQSEAGSKSVAGGVYQLQAGFWANQSSSPSLNHKLWLPVIVKPTQE